MAEEADEQTLPENETGEEQETEEETEGPDDESEEPEEESEESEEAKDPAGSAGDASISRRESRNARQARENRELREKLARLEGEREAATRAARQPDPETARRQREEQLALMTPEERARFEDRETIQRLEQQGRATQFMMADIQDKNSYDVLCSKNPVAAKYRGEVETLLANMRASGSTAPRETLLKYIVGEKAMQAASKPAVKKKIQAERQQAQTRVVQAQGKGTSARGDAGGKQSVKDLEARILEREARGDYN